MDTRIIAIVLVYNEEDVVGSALQYLHDNQISFVVLDGGSTDRSLEIVRGFGDKGLLAYTVFPNQEIHSNKEYDWAIRMASDFRPDWILINDADEFYEPRESGRTLAEAISREADSGYNVIQFDHFAFRMTEKDVTSEERDVRKRLRYYSWVDDFRFKAWKYSKGIMVGKSGSHIPELPWTVRVRLSPHKFVLRHYPFRTPEQAKRKMRERLEREDPEDARGGLGAEYYGQECTSSSFVFDSSSLNRYEEDRKWVLPESSHRVRYAFHPYMELLVRMKQFTTKLPEIVAG